MSKGYNHSFPVISRSSAAQAWRSANYSAPLLGSDFSSMSHSDKISIFYEILNRRIHGISFSPYMDGQSPGTPISEQQILQRMNIIRPYTNWVRTFSCIDGNQKAPKIAHDIGLKTMVGVSLGEELDKNEIELNNGIELAKAGHADILAIGNEVLLRGDLTEDQLIDYINRAKQAVPGVPVSYVDAYFLFENHPRVTEACDVLLVNCYPFWESCAADYSLIYMKEMYRRAVKVANGKKVIISETGWPNTGTAFGDAIPSAENALAYFINTYQWAKQEDIDIFYFSSFDESWKTGDEGDVGAYWGLWDKDGNIKYK